MKCGLILIREIYDYLKMICGFGTNFDMYIYEILIIYNMILEMRCADTDENILVHVKYVLLQKKRNCNKFAITFLI